MTKPVVFLIIFSFALTSCLTEKKQQRIAHAYFSQHPVEKAEICEEFIDVDKVIPGVSVVTIREVEAPEKVRSIADYIDSIQAKVELTGPRSVLLDSLKRLVLKDCTPKEIIKERVDTIPWENKAKLVSRDAKIFKLYEEVGNLKAQLKAAEADKAYYRKRNSEKTYALLAIFSAIAVFVYLKIRGIVVSSIFNIFRKNKI